MAITHERKFDVILNIFDVDGTAIRGSSAANRGAVKL